MMLDAQVFTPMLVRAFQQRRGEQLAGAGASSRR